MRPAFAIISALALVIGIGAPAMAEQPAGLSYHSGSGVVIHFGDGGGRIAKDRPGYHRDRHGYRQGYRDGYRDGRRDRRHVYRDDRHRYRPDQDFAAPLRERYNHPRQDRRPAARHGLSAGNR